MVERQALFLHILYIYRLYIYILVYPFIHSYFVLRPGRHGPVARVTASSALIEV